MFQKKKDIPKINIIFNILYSSFVQTATSTTYSEHTTIQYDITVPAGKLINVKQLIGEYGPFSVRSAHFVIEETYDNSSKKRELSRHNAHDEKRHRKIKLLRNDEERGNELKDELRDLIREEVKAELKSTKL